MEQTEDATAASAPAALPPTAAVGSAAPLEAQNREDDDDDDDETDSSYTSSSGPHHHHHGADCNPDLEERQHFLDVCYSLINYETDARRDLMKFQEQMVGLSPSDQALWKGDASSWMAAILPRVEINARFLARLPCPDVCGIYLGEDAQGLVTKMPDKHRVASRNASKVRSTLRQFVRDWAIDGEAERTASYTPLIDALKKYLPVRKPSKTTGSRTPAVLCPGCGLGRLPFELARRGYAAQGNEFSYHMLLGTHLMLNRASQVECHTIYPYVLSTANRRGREDHLREVRVPDVCAMTALAPGAPLSMAAGEFVDLYQEQVKEWDAVLTCFFLDTAKNIYLYIRTIATVIRPGGVWINLGPLLYHYAESEQDISVEPSWEEVKPAIGKYFTFLEEREHEAHYTANPYALMSTKYRCIFFAAQRNEVEVSGVSNPVF
mmetsp:Transcript_31678/g.73994  ORF Transcript_31678/g.73994 Transcript_31678/m.73994 type:complete len:435 (-) Transcript_31678:98-1402(-)